MIQKEYSHKQIGKDFSKKWWSDVEALGDIFDDLMSKLKDRSYVVNCKSSGAVNRAFMACEHVIKHIPKGGKVLDMACGIGFNSCCLMQYGYKAVGFDASEVAIERARLLAQRLNQDPDVFWVADVECLKKLKDDSHDAVLAMGLFRYLDSYSRELCYENVFRILKPGGIFILSHQNLLFEAFALNDGTLKFWADIIDGYSDVPQLLGGKTVLQTLGKGVILPKRVYQPHSISRHMTTHAENPLNFEKVANRFGFHMNTIRYAAPHLLPPFIEAQIDNDALEGMKKELFLDRADDWQSMFLDYEFVAFLEKLE